MGNKFYVEDNVEMASIKTAWDLMQNKVEDYFTDPAIWSKFLFGTLKIILIFIIGRLIIKVAAKALDRMVNAKEKGSLKFDVRRTRTIGKLLRNIVSYVI